MCVVELIFSNTFRVDSPIARQRPRLAEPVEEESETSSDAAPTSAYAPAYTHAVQSNEPLIERLAQLEQRMAQMESRQSATPSGNGNGRSTEQITASRTDSGPPERTPTSSVWTTGATAGTTDGTSAGSALVIEDAEPAPQTQRPLYRLVADDEGNVVYFGLTVGCKDLSVSTGAAGIEEKKAPAQKRTAGGSEGTEAACPDLIVGGGSSALEPLPIMRRDAVFDPTLAPLFKAIATGKKISVTDGISNALLKEYFRFDVLNTMNQSAFERDMAKGKGPMFSSFLLMSIYASATFHGDGLNSYQRRAQGELFERLAKEYLSLEMDGPSKTTTAQGLFLMSERALAQGKNSRGWTYAGMAFRIVQDLNICSLHTISRTREFSEEMIIQRSKLYFTAQMLDKYVDIADT